MSRATLLSISELEPKLMDQAERFNDWYFTVHFAHDGANCLARLSITEGTLREQRNQLSFSRAPLAVEEQQDALVLHPCESDILLSRPGKELSYTQGEGEVEVNLGELTAICRPDRQRIISTDDTIGADLTFTPRGPALHWGHEPGDVCEVTEVTRVSGAESLSDVTGVLTVNGETIAVEGRGLFEHVWFGDLNFFQIRAMNWIYAHFEETYLYLCHCESVTGENQPFHFETGEVYMIAGDELLVAEHIEVMPERWAFLGQARRFIPIEYTVTARTDRGRLKVTARLSGHPLLLQPPARLETLTVNNISGWSTLFYDAPIALEGTFTYKNGRVIELENGVGINERIRVSAL
jgi:hypothetical protein